MAKAKQHEAQVVKRSGWTTRMTIQSGAVEALGRLTGAMRKRYPQLQKERAFTLEDSLYLAIEEGIGSLMVEYFSDENYGAGPTGLETCMQCVPTTHEERRLLWACRQMNGRDRRTVEALVDRLANSSNEPEPPPFSNNRPGVHGLAVVPLTSEAE